MKLLPQDYETLKKILTHYEKLINATVTRVNEQEDILQEISEAEEVIELLRDGTYFE